MRQYRLERRVVVLCVALAACCCVWLTLSSLAAASRGGNPGPNDPPAAASNGQGPSDGSNAGGSDQGIASRSPAAEPASPTTSSSSSSSSSTSGNGANQSGPYNSTFDGSPSGNGNGGGAAVGRPCAGCVGKADNKNPPGQYPSGAGDRNRGYECDANHGIGRTNPAHTGCRNGSTTQGGTTPSRSSSQAAGAQQPSGGVAAGQQQSAAPGTVPAGAPPRVTTPVADRGPGPTLPLLGKRLPFTGLSILLLGLIGALLAVAGVAGRIRTRRKVDSHDPEVEVEVGSRSPSGAETRAFEGIDKPRRSAGFPLLLLGVIGVLLALAVAAAHANRG